MSWCDCRGLRAACAHAAQRRVAAGLLRRRLPASPSDSLWLRWQSAPVCQSGTACQVPTARQNQIDCVNKMPYTNVLVEPGTSFEVLDKSGDFTCNDSGAVVDGKTVITCFGKELYRFDLKLTNTACGGANLQTGTGQCQDGYGFDAGAAVLCACWRRLSRSCRGQRRIGRLSAASDPDPQLAPQQISPRYSGG